MDELARKILRAIALRVDLAGVEGTGVAPQPLGFKSLSGRSTDVSMGTNGGQLTLAAVSEAIGNLMVNNVGPEGLPAVCAPRTMAGLMKLVDSTGRPLLFGTDTGVGGNTPNFNFWGVRWFASAQLSVAETQGSASNASSVYIFDPKQTYLVVRDDIARIEKDSSALFASDEQYIRGLARVTFSTPNPKSVVRIVGIIP